MKGVTILDTYRVLTFNSFMSIFITSLIILLSIIIFVSVLNDFNIGIFILSFLGLLFGIISLPLSIKNIKYDTYYKVTIDEDVKFVEFNNTYEIIKQEGELYTVQLLKKDNNK